MANNKSVITSGQGSLVDPLPLLLCAYFGAHPVKPFQQRGQVYGFTFDATFLGSIAGLIVGGAGSALFGIRIMLAITTLPNVIWVRLEVRDPAPVQVVGTGVVGR